MGAVRPVRIAEPAAATPAMISNSETRTGVMLAAAACVIYSVLAVVCHSDQLIWDEDRYLGCARDLTQGFLVRDDNPDFTNGPGYPLVLYPVVATGMSLIVARLLNAVFIGAATWLVWATARSYAGGAWAVGAAGFVALHPSLLRLGPYLMTEPLTMCCISAFVWSFCKALRSPTLSWPMMLGASFWFAWLTLTRVFFGPVLMATTVIALLLWMFVRSMRRPVMRALVIFSLAFAMCVPYLAYTQAKTGRFLCWSTNGGELLYWLTSHHEGENGHWFSSEAVFTKPELKGNHEAFYRELMAMRVLDQDVAFKEKARKQLRSAPLKVAYNWACNVNRLVFGFPRAFEVEELKTVALVVCNGMLVVAFGIALAAAALRPREVPGEIWLLVAMTAVYLGGATLAPALPRYLLPMAPLMAVAIGHSLHKFHILVRES